LYSPVPDGVSLPAFGRVTADDVAAAIAYLPNKSSAADPLLAGVMRSVADILSPFLVYLFNLSLDYGQFPSCFKAAFLTPVLKKLDLSAFLSLAYL
jgi:hypothetical protein